MRSRLSDNKGAQTEGGLLTRGLAIRSADRLPPLQVLRSDESDLLLRAVTISIEQILSDVDQTKCQLLKRIRVVRFVPSHAERRVERSRLVTKWCGRTGRLRTEREKRKFQR